MTAIAFGKWQPDRLGFNTDVAKEAKGVLMGGNSYLPWPGLTTITAALPAACRGATLARTTSGTYVLFAATAARLYKLSGTSWTNVTRAAGGDYTVADDEQVSFAQFGTDLVAAIGLTDAIQVIDIDAGTNFAALSGSPPNSKYVATIGSQLFLGGITGQPSRVKWSARGDHTFWTKGQRDSDIQDFQDGGDVVGLTNIETGLVFQTGAIRRMTPVSSRAIYSFTRLEHARGLIAPASLVQIGRIAYFLSEEGFQATDGSGASVPIGVNIVDAWFQGVANADRIYAMVGAVDPVHTRIYWLFATSGNASEVLDHCLCYDVANKGWTHADLSASYIFAGSSGGYTIETLDAFLTTLGLTMDTATFSVDARWLQASSPALAAFDSDHKLAFFSGSNIAATLETADFQPVIGRRAYVRGITPIGDNASATVAVGATEIIGGTPAFNSAVAVNARGFAPQHISGRVHRVRVSCASGDSWSHMRGVDVDATDDGER